MKRLIAKRPIQYMGRTYDVGEALPAHDTAMVAAWLAAGSAAWNDPEREQAEHNAAVVAANIQNTNNALAVSVLLALGIHAVDDVGVFVGPAQLMEQVRDLGRLLAAQEGQEGQDHAEDGENGQEAKEGGAEGENAESAGEPEPLTGHMDAAQLERMTKPDLLKLAEDMGVDVSTARNNAERAALLAAVPVQAPEYESGGAR